MINPCHFSPDKRYRYTLWREIDASRRGIINFIGLNPSTADDTQDDPTIRRCKAFTRAWGGGVYCMTNIFAFRATDPRVMFAQEDPVGADNNKWLVDCARSASLVVAAWGTHGAHRMRGQFVKYLLREQGIVLHHLGLSKHGYPKHPLYLAKTTEATEWV